jgi:hypothetical protein
MKRRSNGIVWGGLLITLGVVWLLRNMGLLQVDWSQVLRFWPALLILAGVSLLVAGRERGTVAGGLAGLLIALAVLGGILHRTDRAFDRNNWNFKWDGDDSDTSDTRDDEYRQDRRNRRSGRTQANHYQYDMESGIREATFNLEGGAGEFRLKGTTDKLFEADTRTNLGGFVSNTRTNQSDGTATVDFKMEDEQINLKDGKVKNEVTMRLNESPVWTILMAIGAGKANMDLSPYKVKAVKVSTGVADVTVRLGEKNETTDVNVESGVAAVTFEVPRSAGCEVFFEGALNVKEMDDLEKISNSHYRSANFDSARQKITIRYEAGLSKVNIRRY